MKGVTAPRLAALAAVAVAALAYPAWSLACACCANRGDYFHATERVEDFELGELLRLRFASSANLRQTAAFPEDVKGLKIVAARYAVTQIRHGRIFVLTLRDSKGKSGTISFVIPFRATKHHVDMQDGRKAPGGGPLLYREWTFAGTLEGTAVTGKPRFLLVLQGRGNTCMNARDFRSWILRVSGPTATFQLYGAFRAPGP